MEPLDIEGAYFHTVINYNILYRIEPRISQPLNQDLDELLSSLRERINK